MAVVMIMMCCDLVYGKLFLTPDCLELYAFCCFIFSWDDTFKRELEVYRETKDVGDIW